MSEPGDGGPEAAPVAADIPPTRKHEAPVEPPPRTSHLNIAAAPMTFPDDGPVSRNARLVDHYLGIIEQGLTFGLLALVAVVAAFAAVHDKLVADHLGRWWHDIVRDGTFSVAMFAAVFATQQQRHLAMDLVSRRLTPRGRLILGVLLKLLTIAIAGLLFKSGLHQRDVTGGDTSISVFGLFHIIDADVVTTISVGAALIIVHSALHITIDADYLVRGKLPPERARSGH